MEFQIQIISGADEGKIVRVDEKPALIGRSDVAAVRLTDESISWEHATLQVSDGKLFIENLSSLGTRLRGQRITVRTRLGYEDEVELSARCRLRVEQVGAGKKSGVSLVTVLLVALVLFLGAGVAAFVAVQRREQVVVAATDENWANAARQLDQRLEQWAQAGRVPERVLGTFRDAIRLERAGNASAAGSRWRALSGALLTLPTPDAVGGHPTFAENYGGTSGALSVLMGMPGAGSGSEERWRSDRAFADALVRFVYRRAELTRSAKES